MQPLLSSDWLNVKQLCFVNTMLHRAYFLWISAFTHTIAAYFPAVLGVLIYNEFKGQKVLFVEVCSMYL